MSFFIDAYTAHQQVRGFSPRTIGRRRWSLRLWLEHLERHGATVTTATVNHLESFLARWPSPQTRYSVRADIHQFHQFLDDRDIADCPDPTRRLPAPKVPKRLPTPIPAVEVRRLIDILTGPDRLIVMLAAYAGLRVSEISEISGEDIDLEGRWLTVHGKGAVTKVIPLSAALALELAGWPRQGRLVELGSGTAVGNRIRVLFRRHRVSGRPHDLRHSFGTGCYLACRDIVAVQQLMRHAEVATTMRYVKPSPLAHRIVDQLYEAA